MLDWTGGEGRMPGLNRVSSGTFWGAIHCGGEHGRVKELGGGNELTAGRFEFVPNPGIEPSSPAMQVDSLPAEPPGKPYCGEGTHNKGGPLL